MNKHQGTILDRAMAARGWDPADDPHSLLVKYPKARAQPICYCLPPEKGRLGGMVPAVDLENRRVVCRSCLKTISDSCGRRNVVHLRGLLKAYAKNPQNVDWDSIQDLLL